MTFRRTALIFLPAAVLAGLVLYVFASLQYYGPESAVRRFHEAILRGDGSEFEEVTLRPTSFQQDTEMVLMQRSISSVLNLGYRVRLQELQREPGKVTVTVYYYTPDGMPAANRPYVAVKTSTGWKVDVHQTWGLWNAFFRPRPI